jgi:hypothetical protein
LTRGKGQEGKDMDIPIGDNRRERFSRVVRTESSEVFLIWRGKVRLGQVDIHYSGDTIYATLVLEAELTREEEDGIVTAIDDEIVSSYLPSFDRESLIVTVFRGEEVRSYSDGSNGVEREID